MISVLGADGMNATDEHGYSAGNPFRRRHPDTDDSLGAGNETPVDLAAVQADDALLDMLGGNGRVSDDAQARVLVAWRRDVDSEPIGELVDTDTALAAISAARKSAPCAVPGWVWLLLTFLSSAAFFALLEAVTR